MAPEPGDTYKPLEETETEEKEGNVGMDGKEKMEKLTVEEMVNRSIGADRSSKLSLLKFVVLLQVGITAKLAGPVLSYIPIFTGFLNYKDWRCISTYSTKCFDLMTNFTGDPVKFFSRDTICGNNLVPGVDFEWTIERTSYALEWGLICGDEKKGANLKSFFFVGAFIGMFLGYLMFDKIGRKATSLIVIAISVLSTLATTFVNNYHVLLVLRIVQGIGSFPTLSGLELLAVEFTPTKLRNLGQLVSSCNWTFGGLCIIGVSYAIQKWQHVFLVESCLLAVSAISVIVYPESPRFQLIKGKDEQAKATFKKISKIFKTEDLTEKVELTYVDYDQSYLEQLKDFKKYPLLLKNTLRLMVCWLMISTVSYGLLFSWGKLGTDIYTSILFASIGSFIAKGSGMTYYMIHFFGRRLSLVINFAAVALLFFLSIAAYGVRISDNWTLDNVVCLIVSLFSSGVWSSMLLLTKELSPTSHRGMVISMCSSFARIGAFVGPYLALLYNTLDARIVFCVFGSMAAFASFVAFFNSDSTGKPIPSTPADIVEMNTGTGHEKLEEKDSDDA